MNAYKRSSKWNRPEDFYTIVCRPALPKDTQQVLDLTHLIWEGQDYVPYVWEEWLSDYEGMLAVVEFGGRVIGLGKLSLLAEGQWWLEGLRVHPDFQGHGVGTHMHDYLVKHWLKWGDGVLRLATGSNRLSVHRMSEHTGFARVGEFSRYKAEALSESSDAFSQVIKEDIQQAMTFMLQSESLQLSNQLMDLGWKWASMNQQNLYEAIETDRVWWWQGGEGLLAVWEDDWDEETSAVIICIACKLEQMTELLVDFRRLAGSLQHKWAGWLAPPLGTLIPALEAAGYWREWENSLYIFEKQHP